MPESIPSTLIGLLSEIEESWAELLGFLGPLSEENASGHDHNGWSIEDHLTHIAVWEDSVAVLFRGGQRHEPLGIDEAFYKTATFDQINAIIKERHGRLGLRQAVTRLTQVHQSLMAEVRGLTGVQLRTTVRDYFPQAPRGDDRTLLDFIYWNTADHFREHLPWMRSLTTKSG